MSGRQDRPCLSLILAIETATPHGSVALVSEGKVLSEISLPCGRQASATVLSAVSDLLRETGRGPGDITRVAVSAGPGSFTGLRVGMAAAKGFCFGWGVPIVPVPTLHALAMRFPVEGVSICPVLDARKQELYAALFRREGGEWKRLSPDAAISPEALPGTLPEGRVFFCGDGAIPFGPLFRDRLGDRATFAPEGEGLPSASTVGLFAARLARQGAAADIRSLVPAYLRRSEAENGTRWRK
ncbi:MAG: tRNA (adenosine(37)-N6)-threonylcarbamoyltransferase complex dimerization subunit type 1 TsaB [Deltaproteobacteria bacterium]|nr:tRNA (adenosine(37)-N6)-threonylcarbamoyltransferase complex dimerization subunit type 1 TsaB [Deltaproteobacteria bacterium]